MYQCRVQSHQGQWWSILRTQWPQRLQWWDLLGLIKLHLLHSSQCSRSVTCGQTGQCHSMITNKSLLTEVAIWT